MITRGRTLAALAGGATAALVVSTVAQSLERHLVRGESMKPAFLPRDTVVSVRADSALGRVVRPRHQAVAVIALPWEHDLLGIKRLVAGPGEPWTDGPDHVRSGPGWVAIGDQRDLSTDSRHHGRVPTECIRGIVVARVAPRSPTLGAMAEASGAATIHIDAPPEAVYDLVADIRHMGEWSPETFRARWRRGSTRAEIGARFRGWNRRGAVVWFTDPVVTAASRGVEFSFETMLAGFGPFTRWTFRFAARDGGTEVEESWEQLDEVPGFTRRWLAGGRVAAMEAGMDTTLRRIKIAAEVA